MFNCCPRNEIIIEFDSLVLFNLMKVNIKNRIPLSDREKEYVKIMPEYEKQEIILLYDSLNYIESDKEIIISYK